MSEKDLNQEEEATANPTPGSESDDSLDELFQDAEVPEDETSDEKVARLEKEVSDIKKGVSKFFSEKGREKKAEVKAVETPKANAPHNDDVTELFFTTTPQAEAVKDQLQQVADKLYGGSLLKAWRGEEFLREKAEDISKKTKEAETNKSKIQAPAQGRGGSRIDLRNMSTQDALKLGTDDFVKWSELHQ